MTINIKKWPKLTAALIVAIATAIVLLPSCSKKQEVDLGNTIPNIVNGAMAVRDDVHGITYYSNMGLYASVDGARDYLVSKNLAKSLLLHDNKLYYVNQLDYNHPHYIDITTGEDSVCLNDTITVDSMSIYYDKIYYLSNSNMNEEGIYCMNLDGTEVEKILDVQASSMFIYEDQIYYVNRNDKNTLYRSSMKDGELLKMTGTYTFCPFMDTKTERIYYSNQFGVFSLNKKGEDQKQLCEELVRAINIDANGDFWFNVSDELGSANKGLYKFHEKTGLTQILDVNVKWIARAGDWMYFRRSDDNKLMRCKADGSNMEEALGNGTVWDAEEEIQETNAAE